MIDADEYPEPPNQLDRSMYGTYYIFPNNRLAPLNLFVDPALTSKCSL